MSDYFDYRFDSKYTQEHLQKQDDRWLGYLKQDAEREIKWKRDDRNFEAKSAAFFGAVAFVGAPLLGYGCVSLTDSVAAEAQAAMPVWQANADKPVTNVQVTFADQPVLQQISGDCIAQMERNHEAVSYKLQADGSIALDTQLMSAAEVKTAFTTCVGQELQARTEMEPYGLLALPLALAVAAAFPVIKSARRAYGHQKRLSQMQSNLDAANTEIARRAEEKAAAPQPAAQ